MVTVKETLRGNERIQQLMEEFPECPRTLVIKADMIREGIRPNETTRQIGRWAIPNAPWYFEYSRESKHSVENKGEAYFKEPQMGHFGDGVAWQFLWLSTSPYDVRYEGAGRYRLYRDDEPLEEVFFPPRPQWMDRQTSSGKPMSAVMQQRGEDTVMVTGLNYCEFFKDDNGCRYCNINASELARQGLGLERVLAKRDEDIYETFTAILQERCVAFPGMATMSGGAMLDSSKEAANYARIARVLKQAMTDVGREVRINVSMQAVEPEEHVILKEAGVSRMCHALEVWDPRLFEIICPGKAKNVGRERWMERLIKAQSVYESGWVDTAFVAGVELVHPEGFKTEDEAAESFLEGCKWSNENGIYASAILFRPVPGTMFEGVAPPRTEYFLRIDMARFKMGWAHQRVKLQGTQPRKNPFCGLGMDPGKLGLRQANGT